MPETDGSRLLDLLVRWEDLRDAGQEVTAESSCADCPELLPALRERLNALLAADGALQTRDTGQFTDSFHPGKSPGAPPRPARESAAGGTAATIPGYEILRELGSGGMGVMYLVRQAGVGRLVAIKMVLSGAQAAAVERTRFEAGVAAIGRLRHPNLMQVFEFPLLRQ